MCGDEVGLGTGVMGMGWEWGEICGDGVGMGRTSCPRAAVYSVDGKRPGCGAGAAATVCSGV